MNDKKAKISLFLGATFFASVFLGRASGKFFTYSFFEFLTIFWEFLSKALLRLMLAGLAFCLPALFLTTPKLLLGAALVNGLGFLFGFGWVAGSHDWQSGLILAFLFVLCQHFFFKEVQGRAKKFVSFSPRDIFIPKIAPFFFLVTLIFAFSFYLGLKQEIGRGEFVIPEKVFEEVIGPVTQVFQKQLQEGLKRQLSGQLDQGLEEEIGDQDLEELLRLLEEEAKETAGEGEFRQELGFKPELFEIQPLNLKELRVRIQEMIEPFLKYLPFLAAFSLYFTLRIVVGFLFIFLPWLIPLMFRILIKFGVLRIVEEKEIVSRISL